MPEPSTTPLKALVAEDEPAMLNLVARHLKQLGFEVHEASEGDRAWEVAKEQRPDLVLLDVMMPGMSGWEVCKRIKAKGAEDGAFEQTAVIMLTGIGENLNEMTSPLFAADAWLNKPFDFPVLDEKIREILGQYGKSVVGAAPSVSAVDAAKPETRTSAARGSVKASSSTKARAKKSSAKKTAAPAKKAGAPSKSAKKAAGAKSAGKTTRR
jgi:DNA-binding response OmpR family regulator